MSTLFVVNLFVVHNYVTLPEGKPKLKVDFQGVLNYDFLFSSCNIEFNNNKRYDCTCMPIRQ